MAKLTLEATQNKVGVGEFSEKTVKFLDKNGQPFEGEVLIKRLSHDEKVNAVDVWDLEKKTDATLDQITKAIVFAAVYSSPSERFFPEIKSTGTLTTEFIDALYAAVDEVHDFAGKKWISKQKNSGASSSLTESAEEPLKKPKKQSARKKLQSGKRSDEKEDHSSLVAE